MKDSSQRIRYADSKRQQAFTPQSAKAFLSKWQPEEE
jgi:hypothetical protein